MAGDDLYGKVLGEDGGDVGLWVFMTKLFDVFGKSRYFISFLPFSR